MFTLVYIKNQFNRPENLLPFLKANVGESTLIRVDCITPFQGSEDDIVNEVCRYLNTIDSGLNVSCESIQNSSNDNNETKQQVHFLVMQVKISQK
jgi:hypothetical protein